MKVALDKVNKTKSSESIAINSFVFYLVHLVLRIKDEFVLGQQHDT
jgi:hypothetical protein